MRRIIGNQPEGPPLNAHKTGNHALPIAATQFHKAAAVSNHLNDSTHIISALSVFRNNVAQFALVFAFMAFQRTLKITQHLLGHGGGMRLIVSQ